MLDTYISGLAEPATRYGSSEKIAEIYNCKYLLILIYEPEISSYLPPAGYPQTLPFDETWTNLIKLTQTDKFYQGEITYPNKSTLQKVSALEGPNQSIVLLIGGSPDKKALEPLERLLPIVIKLFSEEKRADFAEVKAALAEKSAIKAEKLAKTIDMMRLSLKTALVTQETDKRAIKDLLNKKDEFMNIASHELKTPVTSLKAYLQLLSQDKTDKASQKSFLEKANIQVNKVTQLIDELLDVSKIQAGQLAFNFSEFDLGSLIKETCDELQLINEGFLFKFTDQLLRASIVADRERLKQVLVNLLSNAIKYSPGSKSATVSLEQSADSVKVEITDNGIGIDPDVAPHVFDRFFRAHKISSSFSGLGLGLYISKEIIARHLGEIGVRSLPNAGSTFWFTLPYKRDFFETN